MLCGQRLILKGVIGLFSQACRVPSTAGMQWLPTRAPAGVCSFIVDASRTTAQKWSGC